MCHNSGAAAQDPTHCRALVVALVPACPLRWVPGLAWELPVTSARDCDITKWRCREGAWGASSRGAARAPARWGTPKRTGQVRAGALQGGLCVSGGSPACCQPGGTMQLAVRSSLSQASPAFPLSLGPPLETASLGERIQLRACGSGQGGFI